MKIAYLSCVETLPGSLLRRDDAFEHDLQVRTLRKGLDSHGVTLEEVDWRDQNADWTVYAAALIGTTWDYIDYADEFLETLRNIERQNIPLFNSSRYVAWNQRKTYLKEVSDKGVRTIPTLWIEEPTVLDLQSAFDHLNTDKIVVKRQIGAGASDQISYKREDDLSDYPHSAMVQPFLPTIQTEGEYSFIVIDGELSHVLIKRAKPGDYRIQSLYGGSEEKVTPSSDDCASAMSVLKCLDETPLYARIDMIRLDDGALGLMELELIEPYLYPEQGSELGERLANALIRRLGKL